MSFFSNIGENLSNFFTNIDQKNYVSQQVDVLNQQIEENQKRVRLVLFFFLGGVAFLLLIMLFQRR
jgi:uncharacterized protein YeeX (DUF496 family)